MLILLGAAKRFLRFLDVGPEEVRRVGTMFCLFFFLLAANSVLKILRDSVFLANHSVTELPYLYLSVAFLSGVIIAAYTRHTARAPIYQLIVASNAFILSNTILFWFLRTFFDAGWLHYAFYIWSAMVGAITITQSWTFASELFDLPEATRFYGIFTAGGTLGGAAGAFGVKWAVLPFVETNQLFWFAAAFIAAACGVAFLARKERRTAAAETPKASKYTKDVAEKNSFHLLHGSRYLQVIAGMIFVSVLVSTLIDFQFKAAVKTSYPSEKVLTDFFSTYYTWLYVVTFLAQVVLTRKFLAVLGVIPSLLLTPAVLGMGSTGIMVWPGLFTATATRLADVALRTSIHRSGIEILYIPVTAEVKRRLKTFLDVVVERLGDATAGFIILVYTAVWRTSDVTEVHFICIGLILVWIFLASLMRSGFLRAPGTELEPRTLSHPEKD